MIYIYIYIKIYIYIYEYPLVYHRFYQVAILWVYAPRYKRRRQNSTATWGFSIARDNHWRVRDLTDCPRSSWGKRWRQHVNPRLLGREKVALSAGSP